MVLPRVSILGSTITSTFIVEPNTKESLQLVYKLQQHVRSDKNGSVPHRGCGAQSASFIQTKNKGQTSRSQKAVPYNSITLEKNSGLREIANEKEAHNVTV